MAEPVALAGLQEEVEEVEAMEVTLEAM